MRYLKIKGPWFKKWNVLAIIVFYSFLQYLLQKEEETLREESGSGEDTVDKNHVKRKKRILGKYAQGNPDQNNSSSAAARSSTGGSLGSLHDLTDIKVSEKPIDNQKGVASRSRGGKKKISNLIFIS